MGKQAKNKENKLTYAQEMYAQKDDRLYIRINSDLKKILKNYCYDSKIDVSKAVNDTIIWTLNKRGYIDSPMSENKNLKFSDWGWE